MHTPENTWLEPAPQTLSGPILTACNEDPLVASILLNRGFARPDRIRAFLSPDRYIPAPPEQLPDLVQAAELIHEAIRNHHRILVWGDFDVDGQTATALLMDGLGRLGADVVFHLPDRAVESHGIKVESLQSQIAAHSPDILLTCDTGISEFDAIAYARSFGLKVIVTDHHELDGHLPDAEAVINPVRLASSHPMANLPGVGVAYCLMQYLAHLLDRPNDPLRLLDLVALGIVGDVATQTDDTRYLLQIGLERLRKTQRIGLEALMEVANLSPLTLTAEQIGYQLGPRLSAAGRLADAALSVELLTTSDRARARLLAQQLEGLNNERRAQTRQIEAAAKDIIAKNPALLDYAALVLFQPNWNPGILGIVAARLAERYHRPVVLLAGRNGEGSDLARGSARSIEGVDIHKAITAQADLLRTYGGHPGAAGLSLDINHIDTFRARLSQSVLDAAKDSAPVIATVRIDAVLTLDGLSLAVANSIARLAPFGEGNPPVTLATMGVGLAHASLIGREGLHRKLVVQDDQGHQQPILWWGGAAEPLPIGIFDVAYTLSINARQELEASLVDIRQCPDAAVAVQAPAIHLEDWRHDPDSRSRLAAILAESPDSVIWAEAYSRQEHPTWKRRVELDAARALVIYTVPSDPHTLRQALADVDPEVLYVLAVDPPLKTFQDFLTRLHTAARNAIDHLERKVSIGVLCGATAASPEVVRAGLDFLMATHKVGEVTWLDDETVSLSPTPEGHPDEARVARARAILDAAYREMEAYRRYFRGMPLDRLLKSR